MSYVHQVQYHSIGPKVKKNNRIQVGSSMDRREFKGKANLKKCVFSFERNVERDTYSYGVSDGREFQSRGVMREKALFTNQIRTYGMEITDEPDDLVDRVRWERIKTIAKICRLLNLEYFVCKKA